jgi:gas vesicle protein
MLEHLLCRLYDKQDARKDGLLRWSDFRQIGELERALANHAESVFSTLKSDEQSAFDLVMRQMVTPELSIKGVARPAAYRNLVTSPGMNDRKKPGAKGLVDRFLREGLFCMSTDPSKEMLVSVSHETLLRKWPRLSQLASADRDAVYLRNRLDKRLKAWLAQGQKTGGLLDAATGLAEAKSLLKDSRASLTESETGYIEKSLAKQKRRGRARNTVQLLAAGSVLLLAGGAARWWAEGLDRKKADALPALAQTGDPEAKQSEGRVQFSENRADLIAGQLSALETELKKARERAQLAERSIGLAASQRSTLEIELQKAEERVQLAQKSAALALNGRSALENALQSAQEKSQVAQKNADLATSQRNALEAELRKAKEQAQLVQRITELFAAQPHSANDLPSTEHPAAADAKPTPAAETHLADASAQPAPTTPIPQKSPRVKQDQ